MTPPWPPLPLAANQPGVPLPRSESLRSVEPVSLPYLAPQLQEADVSERGTQSLGGEEPPEEETHSSLLAWEIPRTEEPGGLLFLGSQSVRHD